MFMLVCFFWLLQWDSQSPCVLYPLPQVCRFFFTSRQLLIFCYFLLCLFFFSFPPIGSLSALCLCSFESECCLLSFSFNTPPSCRLMSHRTAPFFLSPFPAFSTLLLSVCPAVHFLQPLLSSPLLPSSSSLFLLPCHFTLHFGLCFHSAIRVVLDTGAQRE